jgi:transcriptional regulator with XRE-family HTH domain
MTNNNADANLFVKPLATLPPPTIVASVYDRAMASVGDRIREVMKKLDVESASELGRRAGIPGQTVTNILRSADKDPSYTPRRATLESIAKAAGVSVVWLEHGVDGRAAADLTLEREPEHTPGDDEVPLETAALRVMDRDRHTLRDLDAVRAAIHAAPRKEILGADLGETATRLLDAARGLRLEGEPATPTAILWRVAVGRHQRGAELVDELDEAEEAEVNASLRAKGLVPGQGRAQLEADRDAMVAAQKKGRRA